MFLSRTASKLPPRFGVSDILLGNNDRLAEYYGGKYCPARFSFMWGQGGKESTELQEMESVEVETDATNGGSDEIQFDRQRSTGDE